MKKVVHIAGKRKRAIARATIREGKGILRINSKLLDAFTSNEIVKLRIREPLILAGSELTNKVDINADVHGGGFQAQGDAVRLAIGRGLVSFFGHEPLKKKFLEYDRQLLVADVRRKEACKPNDSKARAARQKSYR